MLLTPLHGLTIEGVRVDMTIEPRRVDDVGFSIPELRF
jgi:hypothetical protein